VRFRRRKRKSKGKNQKAKISEPGRGPDWKGICAARQPADLQHHRGLAPIKTIVNDPIVNDSIPNDSIVNDSILLSGAGNWPPRGIFAARLEMGL
jgi:hypothetical protein